MTRPGLTAAEMTALLLELCAHPGGVVEALRVLGVRGWVDHCLRCPIAEYFAMHGGMPWVTRYWCRDCRTREIADLPDAVREVIARVDSRYSGCADLIGRPRFARGAAP